jgi:signal transduction histidine kinase
MRLRERVLILSLSLSLLCAAGLAYLVLRNSFDNSLTAETRRGVHNSGMLAASLQSGLEAFSVLSQPEAAGRAVRLTARYMTEPAFFTVSDPEGRLLHDNVPLQMAQLLNLVPEQPGQYRLVRFMKRPYQLLRRSIRTQAGDYQLVYARDLQAVYDTAARQTRQVSLLLLGLAALLGLLLFVWLRAFFKPLRQLEAAAGRIAKGEYEARAPVVRPGDEAGQLAQGFNLMAQATQDHIEALTRRDEAQQQFIADMAHELKTPLTSMIGYADLLYRKPLQEEQRQQALQAIIRQGERLERMGKKLLHLARLQGGQGMAVQAHPVQDILKEAAEALAPQAGDKQVELIIKDGAHQLVCDRDLVLALLQNLLGNALEASAPGHRIWLAAEENRLTVQDEGCGIEESHLPHLTEAFYMVDASRSRAHQGAGLGLALARRIARIHGGDLEIKSQPGQGTCVSVRFWEGEPPQSNTMFTA